VIACTRLRMIEGKAPNLSRILFKGVAHTQLSHVRLAGGWWLVLVCSERKILLASCWWLICSERKVLLAGGW
jgi:hypothetical protein